MKRYKKILRFAFIIGFSFVVSPAVAQVYTDTLTPEESIALQKRLQKELKRTEQKVKLQILPMLYYTPETRLAFGASAMVSFTFNSSDSLLKFSTITPSFVYTLNKQMLAQVGFDLQLNRKWMLNGKLGYFIYPYFFAGIGNTHDGSYREWYDANYPVLATNLYRYVYENTISVGVRYKYQNTQITSISDSLLRDGNVPGSEGSIQSILGFGIRYDARDFLFSATKGWFIDFSTCWANNALGSTYQDQYSSLDIRKYISLTPKKDILALQLYSEVHSGEVPFNLMAMLGGDKMMRGYQKGVYRDRQMVVGQIEYRSRLFLKYLTAAAFFNYGSIGGDFKATFSHFRYTYGGGLRFTPTPENRYFIRVDYARGVETQGFYVGVGEAF
tara:strand:- start:27885 stop:29042 length:1158 start_codon:yes stop_codon:yes gene_type:complete